MSVQKTASKSNIEDTIFKVYKSENNVTICLTRTIHTETEADKSNTWIPWEIISLGLDYHYFYFHAWRATTNFLLQ